MTSNLPLTYTLDAEKLKLNAYRLLCLFHANKEIARTCNPKFPTEAAALLERQFFPREMTELILSIAIGVRVMDDQILSLPEDDEFRIKYLGKREHVNQTRHCMMFDDMSLRDTCNKIIHAIIVEPHSTEGVGSHKFDEYIWQGYSEKMVSSTEGACCAPSPVKWNHLSGYIRLGGSHGKRQWWQLLIVSEFVEAVHELVEAGT